MRSDCSLIGTEPGLDYFARTKIFPIMHTVVLSSKLDKEHPEAAKSIHEAFMEAKGIAYAYLAGIGLGAGDIVSYCRCGEIIR